MENLPKRGRPRKLPEPAFGEFRREFHQTPKAQQFSPFDVPTERTAANRFYADKARDVLPELSKSVRIPDDPVLVAKIRTGIDWILERTTVLAELGRMMVEEPTEEDRTRFQGAVRYIAEGHTKLTAKDAAAYARRMRLGETERRDRLEALHHELNAAINYHRRRFPESTWTDVLKAVRHTEEQIRKKVR